MRGWRILPVLLGLGAFATNALILLSDRAPGLLRRVSARIDAGVTRAATAAGVDVPGRDVRVPQSDFDVHVAIWAVAAVLVGLASWSWMSLFLGNAAVLVVSLGLEVAQPLFSSRNVQVGDILGNVVGVVAGTGAVAGFALLWRVTHPPPTVP